MSDEQETRGDAGGVKIRTFKLHPYSERFTPSLPMNGDTLVVIDKAAIEREISSVVAGLSRAGLSAAACGLAMRMTQAGLDIEESRTRASTTNRKAA